MRRALRPAFLLACLLGCAGSTPPAEPLADKRAAAAESAVKPLLRIGTSNDYAPFSKDGQGFDVELATRMAGDLGYRVEWVTFDWPELQMRIEEGAFDVAMSGVTWRPERSVVGYMTRAVASGGPCLLGNLAPARVAVNRGGILERWAREKLATAQLTTVEDNTSLPALLERGEVDAIVTDSFELSHFAREGWQAACEPARDRKVYWVGAAMATKLGRDIDIWLAVNEPDVKALRGKWFGSATDWTDLQHLVDLLSRRLELMPAVAAYKRAHGLPIDDPEREAIVLERAIEAAGRAGLEPSSVRDLFIAQMELAKAVQQRSPTDQAAPLDLDTVLRPALDRLGERITSAVARAAEALPALTAEQLDLLVPPLESSERDRLLEALRVVRKASP